MRFLVDECTGPALARWLRECGHDVSSVYEEARGLDDTRVLEKAVAEDRVLITNDKDFGEMIFHAGKPHRGVVLLRLEDERSANKIAVLKRLLVHHADCLEDNFTVATESTVRVIRRRRG